MAVPSAKTRPLREPRESPGRSDGSDVENGTRRLQKMGAVTVGVSLPREWVGERGLTAGSLVHVSTLADGSLLLRKEAPPAAPRSLTLDVGGHAPPEHLFRSLVAAYVGGATEFVIQESDGISPETRSVAKSFCRRTIQPEIASESETALVLRDVSLGSAFSLPQLLHRMYQVVYGLLEESGQSWVNAAPPPAHPFEARDDEVDRQAWLVERVLGLRFGSSGGAPPPDRLWPAELDSYLLLARSLERIADHAVTIDHHGGQLAQASLPHRVVSSLSAYHRQALDHLRRSFEVAEKPDAVQANEIIDAGEALHATHAVLTESLLAHGTAVRLSPLTVASLGMILHSIDRATAYAQDIAELGLDRATVAAFSQEGHGRLAAPSLAHVSTMVEPGGKNRNERKPRNPEQR